MTGPSQLDPWSTELWTAEGQNCQCIGRFLRDPRIVTDEQALDTVHLYNIVELLPQHGRSCKLLL